MAPGTGCPASFASMAAEMFSQFGMTPLRCSSGEISRSLLMKMPGVPVTPLSEPVLRESLIDWFSAALLAPEVKAKLAAQALYPNPRCGADFDAHLRRQSDLYTRLIRELNIKTE